MEDETFDAGIKTGYSYLDHVSDGLRPGELLLIGGESGSGKSMLLMNMAVQMWMQNNTIHTEDSEFSKGYNVLYFSLEMPFKPCLNRVLGRLSGSPTKAIRAAKLNETESAQLKKALRFIKRYPYQFEIVDIPRGATMENLELLYADAKSTYNPDIVVIDYIGLMEYDGAETEDWLKLGKIAEKCHEFSRVNDCITLSAVQLNRAQGKTEDDRIGLHRIGRSAMIMHNANIALQINKRSAEHQYPDMEYFVIKCRDGELGKGRIIKDLKCGTLLDDKTGDNKIEEQFTDVDDISSRMDSLDE
jgi:replicative DNA helicase